MKRIGKQNIHNIKKIFEEQTGVDLQEKGESISIAVWNDESERRILMIISLVAVLLLSCVVYLNIRKDGLSNNENDNSGNYASVSDNEEKFFDSEENEMLGEENDKYTYIYDMDETKQPQISENDIPEPYEDTASQNSGKVEESTPEKELTGTDTDNESTTYGTDTDNASMSYEADDSKDASEEKNEAVSGEEVSTPYEQMNFTEVNDIMTAKDETNLRNVPSQGDESTVLFILKNGETVTRTGVSETGWSRLSYNGVTCYAVTSLLTSDLTYKTPSSPEPETGFKTKFAPCNETVTAKECVNLRSKPSVTDEDSVVVYTLYSGETVIRTGINTDVGWSRVIYNGQELYCISSYIKVVE